MAFAKMARSAQVYIVLLTWYAGTISIGILGKIADLFQLEIKRPIQTLSEHFSFEKEEVCAHL